LKLWFKIHEIMININRNNYEEYFLDFHEGKLSPSDELIFISFLNDNPDLKEELDFAEFKALIADNAAFKNKKGLRKASILESLTGDNFDELCIAKIEGDLNENELVRFEEFVNSSPRINELKLYELTKFTADKTIILKDKGKIKKQVRKAFSFKSNYALIPAAASIIILLSLYLFLPKEIKENKEFIVHDISRINTEKKLPVLKVENRKGEVEKSNVINAINTDKKTLLIDKINEEIKPEIDEKSDLRDYVEIADLIPMDIMLNIENSSELKEVTYEIVDMNIQKGKEENKYISVKTFLASTFNKKVLNQEQKDRIEFFDIAQAGIRGINKLTGSNMKLERKFDKNGIPDKTEFNSRLVAFSTPIKKY